MEIRKMSSTKLKNSKNIDVSTVLVETDNWWEESIVEYSFNIPSAGANLERLMGSNVVRMTDPLFMLELRERVWNESDSIMTKKIEERKRNEIEREVQLLLKGVYCHYNRPKKFIPFHSTVLALDLGDRKNDINEHAEMETSPILRINNRTNAIISDRRLKLKSNRQKNVDHIKRQTKLEGLEPNIEYDELMAIETKIKEIEDRILGGKSKMSKYFPIMNKLTKNMPWKRKRGNNNEMKNSIQKNRFFLLK